MTDLFGEPIAPPRKGQPGYLAHLADLPYRDGLTLWCCSSRDIRKITQTHDLGAVGDIDAVHLVKPGGGLVEAVINTATGEVLSWLSDPGPGVTG